MKFINIQYNQKIIDLLRKNEIYMDIGGTVMFVMLALAEQKLELLDYADDSSRAKRMLILYRLMYRRNLLEPDGDSKYLYKISKQGAIFVKDLYNAFDDEIHAEDLQPSLEKLVVPIVETEKSWEQFSEEFVNVFPKSHRANSKVALIRLERFFKVFPEYKNQKILISAAKLYVKENLEKDESLKFMRHCQYFIFKAEGKEVIYELANWCARIESSKNNEETTYDLSFLNTA